MKRLPSTKDYISRITNDSNIETIKLISQIRKKNEKGLSTGMIAEMLEEDIDHIDKLSDLIKKYPKNNDEEIYKLYHEAFPARQEK